MPRRSARRARWASAAASRSRETARASRRSISQSQPRTVRRSSAAIAGRAAGEAVAEAGGLGGPVLVPDGGGPLGERVAGVGLDLVGPFEPGHRQGRLLGQHLAPLVAGVVEVGQLVGDRADAVGERLGEGDPGAGQAVLDGVTAAGGLALGRPRAGRLLGVPAVGLDPGLAGGHGAGPRGGSIGVDRTGGLRTATGGSARSDGHHRYGPSRQSHFSADRADFFSEAGSGRSRSTP